MPKEPGTYKTKTTEQKIHFCQKALFCYYDEKSLTQEQLKQYKHNLVSLFHYIDTQKDDGLLHSIIHMLNTKEYDVEHEKRKLKRREELLDMLLDTDMTFFVTFAQKVGGIPFINLRQLPNYQGLVKSVQNQSDDNRISWSTHFEEYLQKNNIRPYIKNTLTLKHIENRLINDGDKDDTIKDTRFKAYREAYKPKHYAIQSFFSFIVDKDIPQKKRLIEYMLRHNYTPQQITQYITHYKYDTIQRCIQNIGINVLPKLGDIIKEYGNIAYDQTTTLDDTIQSIINTNKKGGYKSESDSIKALVVSNLYKIDAGLLDGLYTLQKIGYTIDPQTQEIVDVERTLRRKYSEENTKYAGRDQELYIQLKNNTHTTIHEKLLHTMQVSHLYKVISKDNSDIKQWAKQELRKVQDQRIQYYIHRPHTHEERNNILIQTPLYHEEVTALTMVRFIDAFNKVSTNNMIPIYNLIKKINNKNTYFANDMVSIIRALQDIDENIAAQTCSMRNQRGYKKLKKNLEKNLDTLLQNLSIYRTILGSDITADEKKYIIQKVNDMLQETIQYPEKTISPSLDTQSLHIAHKMLIEHLGLDDKIPLPKDIQLTQDFASLYEFLTYPTKEEYGDLRKKDVQHIKNSELGLLYALYIQDAYTKWRCHPTGDPIIYLTPRLQTMTRGSVRQRQEFFKKVPNIPLNQVQKSYKYNWKIEDIDFFERYNLMYQSFKELFDPDIYKDPGDQVIAQEMYNKPYAEICTIQEETKKTQQVTSIEIPVDSIPSDIQNPLDILEKYRQRGTWDFKNITKHDHILLGDWLQEVVQCHKSRPQNPHPTNTKDILENVSNDFQNIRHLQDIFKKVVASAKRDNTEIYVLQRIEEIANNFGYEVDELSRELKDLEPLGGQTVQTSYTNDFLYIAKNIKGCLNGMGYHRKNHHNLESVQPNKFFLHTQNKDKQSVADQLIYLSHTNHGDVFVMDTLYGLRLAQTLKAHTMTLINKIIDNTLEQHIQIYIPLSTIVSAGTNQDMRKNILLGIDIPTHSIVRKKVGDMELSDMGYNEIRNPKVGYIMTIKKRIH